VTISLISLSADRANAYKIQASNDLSLPSPSYISKLGSTIVICGVMDIAMAVVFEILFIHKDFREGLSNDADASKAALL
jgi:hypothetical protein